MRDVNLTFNGRHLPYFKSLAFAALKLIKKRSLNSLKSQKLKSRRFVFVLKARTVTLALCTEPWNFKKNKFLDLLKFLTKNSKNGIFYSLFNLDFEWT